MAERTAATKGFRQRLLTKPFGLGQPLWVEDPAFNVHDHLHHVRLPKPGTMRDGDPVNWSRPTNGVTSRCQAPA